MEALQWSWTLSSAPAALPKAAVPENSRHLQAAGEIKLLIRSLKRDNPNIEKSIFNSIHAVCLDTMPATRPMARNTAFGELLRTTKKQRPICGWGACFASGSMRGNAAPAEILTTSPAEDESAAAGTKALLPGTWRRWVHFRAVPGGRMQWARQLMDISSIGVMAGSLSRPSSAPGCPAF